MNRMTRNSDEFPNKGHPIRGKKLFSLDHKLQKQAHGYILFNCDEVQDYIRENEAEVQIRSHRKRTKWNKAKTQREDFIQWFETRAMGEGVLDWLKELSRGPNPVAQSFSGYVINGYRFHTRQRDAKRKTQNSGVTLEAVAQSFKSTKDENPEKVCITYYGAITNIIELDYYGHFQYVLFKCDWFEAGQDNYGLTFVQFNRRCYKDDPFVLASQVQQCFYVQDPFDENKHYVMKTLPRDLFNIGDGLNGDAQECNLSEISSDPPINVNILEDDGEVDLVRQDVPDDIIEAPLSALYVQQCEDASESEFESESESVDYSSNDNST